MYFYNTNRKYAVKYLLICFSLALLIVSCKSKKTTEKTQYEQEEQSIENPKREFRGTWLSTAWQSRYREMTSQQIKDYIIQSLDDLQNIGINTIIFQVRPQADAFYKSNYEPWSSHLTGVQGKAPDSNFDPLAFIIEESHKRGMELHAWLNPYRVTTSANDKLHPNHVYYRKPSMFVEYGDKIYFDPGKPESRNFINLVVKDIVKNYDVDAIHMDDYFYPYPISGVDFPDDHSFYQAKLRNPKYNNMDKKDWRRDNVNLLIKELNETIKTEKPWVRFGISPFGIYRNKATDYPQGSETNGLQNYNDLYADVLLWAENGWIDYNMPQLYWEQGHKSADYDKLIKWWNNNAKGRPLIIGQDVKRTMDAQSIGNMSQFDAKMISTRVDENVDGNTFWPAYELLDDYKGIGTKLAANYHKDIALNIPYSFLSKKEPKKVKDLNVQRTSSRTIITWKPDTDRTPENMPYMYVVYRFMDKEKEDINQSKNIIGVTNKPYFEIKNAQKGKSEIKYKYVVTALNRFNIESKPVSKKVK